MKVYIVTEGSYSDYHIEQVFSTKEQAAKYIIANRGRYDCYDIEEYEVDDVTIESSDKVYYAVKFREYNKQIKFIDEELYDNKEFVFVSDGNRYGICPIPSGNLTYDQKLKIVSDKYAEYKAKKEGLL